MIDADHEDPGYDAEIRADELHITLRHAFSDLPDANQWATMISRNCIGHFTTVRIDVGHLPSLTSTVIAGLVHLRDRFQQQGVERIVLVGVSDRIHRTLQMMKLDLFFEIRPAG